MSLRNILALLILATASAGAAAQVVINSATQRWQYPESVRLETVLAPQVTNADIYWPAAVLYQLPSPAAESLREQLLRLLTELQVESDATEQQLLQQLATELKSWRLAQPLPFKIDFDRARLDLAANPLLLPGEYYLSVGPRPQHLYMIGAVKGAARTVPHRAATPLQDYLTDLEWVRADLNHLILLQADRRLLTVALTGANAPYQEAQPGSLMIIPFKTSLLNRRYKLLNQLLVELAQYRVAV